MGRNICFYCMHELGQGAVCPACGHTNADTAARQPSYALPCGSLLKDRYAIGRVLGQGGFGITYIGYDVMLQNRVCVKEYYPMGSAMRDGRTSSHVTWSAGVQPQFSEAGKQSFVNEARKAVKLRDLPSVVKVWDIFYENETAYIVMEFVDGVTLKEHLIAKGAPMTLQECYDALEPVMRDLQTIHSLGVIHRDISPDNLMFRSDGGLALLDLGAAKDLTIQSTEASMLVARKGFSPLEQYMQGGSIGPWTDVYALTATIYYCMTGHAPATPADRSGGVPLNTQGMPADLAAFFQQGLALQPKDRFKSMDELRQAMEHLLRSGKATDAPAKAAPAKTKKQPAPAPRPQAKAAPSMAQAENASPQPKRKLPKGMLIGLAGVAAVALLLAVFLAGRSSERKASQSAATPAATAALTLIPTEAPTREYLTRPSVGEIGSMIAAGRWHTVGLKDDGTVAAVGRNIEGQRNVSDWKDIVAVAASAKHTVGLKADGAAVAVGLTSFGQCDVSGWTDIVIVAAGEYHTVGLKADGTVAAVGLNDDGQCDVSGWTDIVAIAAGARHTVGLKANGTVVAVGLTSYGQCYVSGWTNIVAVAAGDAHTVGLRADGTVVAAGRNSYGKCNLSGWKDIVAVAAGDYHTVGLKADGTVVAAGRNNYTQTMVSGFSGVVQIAAGGLHTVALKADGSILSVGARYQGQGDACDWKNIRVPQR